MSVLLNPSQHRAVHCLDSRVLIIAGAGTGKTRVLTEHIRYLIQECQISPDKILTTTFTIKAAQELKSRIGFDLPFSGTFHSLCLKIIKQHITHDLNILEATRQNELALRLFGRDAPAAMEQIGNWKSMCKTIDQISPSHPYHYHYQAYTTALEEEQLYDFCDLILYCCKLWMNDPVLLAEYQEQFQYICIDEFQDTNKLQFMWLQLLMSKPGCIDHTTPVDLQGVPGRGGHLFCVGDDDQAIYGFRGSDNRYILHFKHYYPHATVIQLEENYRSTSQIIQSALRLVRNNKRFDKKLTSMRSNGSRPRIMTFANDVQEGRWLTEQILSHTGTQCILVRTLWQVSEYQRLLKEQGLGRSSLVGILLTYLRFLHKPSIDGLLEIINTPKRGFGAAKAKKLQERWSLTDMPLVQAGSSESIVRQLLDVAYDICKLEAVAQLQSQLLTWIALPYEQRVQAIWSTICSNQTMPKFVLRLKNILEMPDVQVLTIHSAKGLEFDTVYLPGWEEGIFPHAKSEDIESELRLGYVAITRGKDNVYITCCQTRESPYGTLRRGRSRFLDMLE